MNCFTPPFIDYSIRGATSASTSSGNAVNSRGTGSSPKYTSLEHQDSIVKRQRQQPSDNGNDTITTNSPFHPMQLDQSSSVVDKEQSSSAREEPTYRISTPSNKHGFTKRKSSSPFLISPSSRDTNKRRAGSSATNTKAELEGFQDEHENTETPDEKRPRAASVVSPTLSMVSRNSRNSRNSRAPTPTISNTSFRTNNSTILTSGSKLDQTMATDLTCGTPHSSLMDTMHLMSTAGSPQSSLMDTMALVSSGSEEEEEEEEDVIIQRIMQLGSSPPKTTSTRENETPPQRPTKSKDNSSISKSQQSNETLKLRQFPYDYRPLQGQHDSPTSAAPDHYLPAHWDARLSRSEVYSRMYRPNRQEREELLELEQFLGIPEATRRRKTIILQTWHKLNPSISQASQQNISMSIVLKRGPVSWESHEECELILLTRGFVVARKVFQYTPRFQLGDLWTNVDNIRQSGMTSFTIACNDMKTLEFKCPTAADLQAWMSALRIVVLQAFAHHSSLLDTDDEENDSYQPGWQYKVIQTPWFTEAVTGQVQLESSMLDTMDNRDLNVLDSYNQCAPLHYATRANNVDAMRFLLQAGADPNLPDGMGQTPMQRADEDKLPKSTMDLLQSYGGKWPNTSPRGCGAVAPSTKDPQRRACRYRTMAILLLLILATGLTTFLIWFLGRDTANSSNTLESSSSSSTAAQYGAEEEQDGLIPADKDTAASLSTTPPPFLVVGVNPIPATNLTTESPFLDQSAKPTIAPSNNTAAIVIPDYSNDTDQFEFGADFVAGEQALPSYSPSSAPVDTSTARPSSTPTRSTSSAPTPREPTLQSSSSTKPVVAEVATSTPTISPSLAVKPTEEPKGTHTTETPTNAPSNAPTSKPKGLPAFLATTGRPTSLPTALATIGSTSSSPSAQVTFDLTKLTEAPTFDPGVVAGDGSVLLPEDMLLYDFLVEHSLDNGYNLRNPKSAQYQAYRWLSGNMDLHAYSDQRKIQRFALATIYFSTVGEEWSNNQFWLSDTNECQLWFSRIAEVASDTICNADDEIITLDLDYNNLSGQLPKEVALLTSLRRMELYGGPQGFLSGTLPTELGYLSALEALSVKGNRMTGTLPTELGWCTALKNLNLSQNRFSGSIPTQVGGLKQLSNMSLETNRLDGKLPSELGTITGLVSITLGTNALTGEIFTEIGLLSALQGLDLEMNNLSSEIPTEFGLLTDLSLLHLSVAGIRGTIPTEIGGMQSLASLQLRGNALNSTIPASIGQLVKIGTLDLSYNKLSGPIPLELGSATLLRSLFLNSNQLTGQVPSEMASLSRLNTLRMDLNNMSGEVPIDVCEVFSNTYPTFYADCLEIACSCCTYCCIDEAGCTCEHAGTTNEFLC